MRKTLLLLLAILALSACKEKEVNQIEYPFDKMYIFESNYINNEDLFGPMTVFRVFEFCELDNNSNLKIATRVDWRSNMFYESNKIIPDSMAVFIAKTMQSYSCDTTFLYTGLSRFYDGNHYFFLMKKQGEDDISILFEPHYLPEDLKKVYNYTLEKKGKTVMKNEDNYNVLFEEFQNAYTPFLIDPIEFEFEPPPIEFIPPVVAKEEGE